MAFSQEMTQQVGHNSGLPATAPAISNNYGYSGAGLPATAPAIPNNYGGNSAGLPATAPTISNNYGNNTAGLPAPATAPAIPNNYGHNTAGLPATAPANVWHNAAGLPAPATTRATSNNDSRKKKIIIGSVLFVVLVVVLVGLIVLISYFACWGKSSDECPESFDEEHYDEWKALSDEKYKKCYEEKMEEVQVEDCPKAGDEAEMDKLAEDDPEKASSCDFKTAQKMNEINERLEKDGILRKNVLPDNMTKNEKNDTCPDSFDKKHYGEWKALSDEKYKECYDEEIDGIQVEDCPEVGDNAKWTELANDDVEKWVSCFSKTLEAARGINQRLEEDGIMRNLEPSLRDDQICPASLLNKNHFDEWKALSDEEYKKCYQEQMSKVQVEGCPLFSDADTWKKLKKENPVIYNICEQETLKLVGATVMILQQEGILRIKALI